MSRTTPPPAAVRKLPVMPTVGEAYGRVFANPHLVARAALLPFFLSLALVAMTLSMHASPLLSGVLVISGFVPYTLFGVAWHRVTLLGPVAGAPPLVPGWARRHWRFLGYLAAITLIGYGTAITVMSLAFAVSQPAVMEFPPSLAIGIGAGVIILAYVMIRLSFVFPAVAVDEAYRLRHSWTHTKGQGFRLLSAVLLTSIPMLMLAWTVSALFGALIFTDTGAAPGQDGGPPDALMEAFIRENVVAVFISQVVLAAINYVLMGLMVSVISISFRGCTGWVPAVAVSLARTGEEG